MSKGSPIVTFRLQKEDHEFIQLFLAEHNANRPDAPLTMGDFIRRAVQRDIDKIYRSRQRRGKPELPVESAEGS